MSRSLSYFPLFACLLILSVSVTRSHAAQITEGDTGDAMVTQSLVNSGAYNENENIEVGSMYYGDVGNVVECFPLPYLAPGQTITGASISFFLEQTNSSPTCNGQLYGLNRVSTTSALPLVSDWYVGANDTANVLLDSTFVTPSTAVNQDVSYAGSSLVSFIQKQYANATLSALPLSGTRYIFFRISPSATQSGNNMNYQFACARNLVRSTHPTLTLTISNGISNTAGRLQFSFSLPQSSITSAGVYNPTTGALIRTLWNNIEFQAGTNYGAWDGNNDSGVAVATGTNYQIRLIYHNVQYVFNGMVGNTSANQTGNQMYRSFDPMMDMSIAAGTAYYAVSYNELQDPFHSFVVGTPQVPSQIQDGFTDCYSSLNYVTADATRSYWAKCSGGISPANTYVIALTNATGAFYTFPKGTTPTGANQSYSSCIDFDATANQPNSATGLAVQQTGNDLFVSHGNLNVVRVFDKVQGSSLGSFPVTNPGRLAVTANGDVWVISNGTTPVVTRYTFANGAVTVKASITGLVDPVGLAVSADDSTLLIADGGASEQIKAFNNTTGAALWAYGTVGGNAVTGATLTTNSFSFAYANSGQTYMAFQADNTFWVGDIGNGRALHYSISGNSLTYIEQIAYTGASYQSTVDLTNATRVFNNFMEYSVNYSLPLGGTNGSWTAVKNWAAGLPNDATHNYVGMANGLNNVVTLSNGHTYGFMNNFTNSKWDLFELPATGPARLTGLEFSNNPRIYEDGTLRFGVVTTSSVSYYSAPLTGFDASNNPKWGSPALLATSALAATDPHPWVAFPERTEVTAGGEVITFDACQGDTGYHLGGIPLGGTAWNWRSSPSTSSSYTGWFPRDGHFDVGNSVQYAGNLAMAVGRNIVYGYHGEFWKNSEASQWVNYYDNGLMVGVFGTPKMDSALDSASPGYAGNSFAPTLVHAPDGNVYLYHNDESQHGGTCRWEITGWNNIAELDGTGAIGGTVNLSANTSGPTVTLTSPTSGAAYVNQPNVTLGAAAASSGAGINSVQFFDGSTSLGSVTVAPYTLNVSGLSSGSHTLTAQATDSNGAVGTSAPVTITISTGGSSTPPPAPASLATGTVTAQSVALSWTQPVISTTSSTIGNIISLQFNSQNSYALSATQVAGAAPYASANFYLAGLGNTTGGPILANLMNNAGTTVPNLGLYFEISGGLDGSSISTLSGTAQDLFYGQANATINPAVGITISNVPYALYDLVVYSMPNNVGSGTQTASVITTCGINTSTVQQTFTTAQTGYTTGTVPIGSNASLTNDNTLVFQGLNCQTFEVNGPVISGIQIVERPYDQGVPTTYTIQRATGTSGSFATLGTVSGTTLNFTDTSCNPSTTYQYRVEATNSYGTSAFSNVISATTPSSTQGVTPPSSPSGTGFAGWQSQYFTAAQLADASISGPSANPYGSGVPNLMAYALQLNPATAQPSDEPHMVLVNGHATLTYFVPSSITDVTYTAEVSSDLVTWNSGPGYTTVVSSVPSSTGTTITVQDASTTSTAAKRFIVLSVTQTSSP